jgi:hypothetical protein
MSGARDFQGCIPRGRRLCHENIGRDYCAIGRNCKAVVHFELVECFFRTGGAGFHHFEWMDGSDNLIRLCNCHR